MLLATYMKKNKWEFEQASNGLLALQAFRESPEGFDVIFMGKSFTSLAFSLAHLLTAISYPPQHHTFSTPYIFNTMLLVQHLSNTNVDVSMPVMTGYESTRHIRTVETERRLAYEHQNLIHSPSFSPNLTSFPFHSSSSSLSCGPLNPNPSFFSPAYLDSQVEKKLVLNQPALIIALTGFSSEKDQELAFESGVDVFMTKPVRFREVGKILEGWMKSRLERERGEEEKEKEKQGRDSGVGTGSESS